MKSSIFKKEDELNMLNYINRWHRIIVRKIAVTFGLSKDLSHHNHLYNPPQHIKINATRHRMGYRHKDLHCWHKEHNIRVAEFHKNHASKIEHGENGNGLLASWERFVYNKGKTLFKTAK